MPTDQTPVAEVTVPRLAPSPLQPTMFNAEGVAAIPQELRQCKQWVIWRFETREGQPTKVPYRPDRVTQRASTTNPRTWASFSEAVRAWKSDPDRFAGIGFVFAADDPFVGIDLDDAIDKTTGQMDASALAIAQGFGGAYFEVSPSGGGMKIVTRGKLPGKGRRKPITWSDGRPGRIEVYDCGRFFTITANPLADPPAVIADDNGHLQALHDEFFAQPNDQTWQPPQPGHAGDGFHGPDDKLLNEARKAQNGQKFIALFDRGDTEGFDSHSEADLALCGLLAFWTGHDPQRIGVLFHRSALMRAKWDEARPGGTYGFETIAKALQGRTEFYAGPLRDNDGTGDVGDVVGDEGIHNTDLGNAGRLVAEHGQDLRFCFPLKRWYVWDGKRWRPDDTAEVRRRAKRTVRSMYREAEALDDDNARKALASHARKSESERCIKAMIELAKSEPGIPVLPDDLDHGPWLLNVQNGTLNLKTGKLGPHDRADLLTRCCPVRYDPDATFPAWDNFLAEVTDADADLLGFLQRAVGYSLTGDVREEVLFFVHGPAAAGKSTFIEAVKAALGDYAKTTDFETFLARRDIGGPRNDIARLAGARFVASVEVDEGKRLAEGLVKNLTGGDAVAARFLYRESFEFTPAFKLWLVANHAPRVNHDDDATWRRILRVPFEQVVPMDRRDPGLKAQLKGPDKAGPAILAWVVKGCLEWQQTGLAIPNIIREATDAYRSDMDTLAEFFEDRCRFESSGVVASSDLFAAYGRWADGNGLEKQFRMGRERFGKQLKARDCTDDRPYIGGRRCRVWYGISLLQGDQT